MRCHALTGKRYNDIRISGADPEEDAEHFEKPVFPARVQVIPAQYRA